LTTLDIQRNSVHHFVSGENVLSVATRCTNLNCLDVTRGYLTLYQQYQLDLLLDRNRLHANALGAPSSVVFEKLVQANSHDHGLSASFVILRDYIFAEQHCCMPRNSSCKQDCGMQEEECEVEQRKR
jgi:hypothetical protein